MLELDSNLESMIKELRQMFSSINGVKSLDEVLTLSYVLEIEDESHRENVEKVAAVLNSQAEKYGFAIEVTAATTDEIKKSQELMADYIASQAKFKA